MCFGTAAHVMYYMLMPYYTSVTMFSYFFCLTVHELWNSLHTLDHIYMF